MRHILFRGHVDQRPAYVDTYRAMIGLYTGVLLVVSLLFQDVASFMVSHPGYLEKQTFS